MKCLVKPFKIRVGALKDVVYCQVLYRNLKIVHVVCDFRPWVIMTKVRYFLLMVEDDNLRTLERLNMIWRFAKDLDLSEF